MHLAHEEYLSMMNLLTWTVSALGGMAVVASGLSDAAASRPPPLRAQSVTARDSTVNGNLTVARSSTINGNLQVRGTGDVAQRLTAHGGLRLYGGLDVRSGGVKTNGLTISGRDGLTVQSGGIKTDSLAVGEGISARSLSVSSTLQAGAINGSTLEVSGGATVNGEFKTASSASVGGALTASGKITGNGVDTGSGGLSTGSIVDSGPASLNGGLSIKGSLDLSQAIVTGFNPQFTSGTVPTLNVGLPTGTVGPLNVSENGQTVRIGVDNSGTLTLNNLAASNGLSTGGNLLVTGNSSVGGNQEVAGTLAVGGASGIRASGLQGLTPAGGGGPGALSLQGSAISLNGDTALLNGSNLTLSAGSGAQASHLNASGDTDVAGFVTINVAAGAANGTAESAQVSFHKSFSSEPAVTLTPLADPAPGSNSMPKYWVEPSTSSSGGSTVYTGFVVHYVTPAFATPPAAFSVRFAYHVLGS